MGQRETGDRRRGAEATAGRVARARRGGRSCVLRDEAQWRRPPRARPAPLRSLGSGRGGSVLVVAVLGVGLLGAENLERLVEVDVDYRPIGLGDLDVVGDLGLVGRVGCIAGLER